MLLCDCALAGAVHIRDVSAKVANQYWVLTLVHFISDKMPPVVSG
jgi:hypothetical protein